MDSRNEPTTPLDVRVIRSARRTKTSAARVVDGVIEVRIPSWMSDDEATDTVAGLVRRIEHKRSADDAIDLMARARTLSATYDLPLPSDIRWVTNQRTRWGSCTCADGVIRISSRLALAPVWVIDHVVLHELTHLVEPGHGPEFQRLMSRDPNAERAAGFLEAMALSCADDRFIV